MTDEESLHFTEDCFRLYCIISSIMVVQEEEEDDIEAIEGHSSLFYYVTEDESSP